MKRTLEESLDLRIRPASQVWELGFDGLWSELEKLGFEPEVSAETRSELSNLSVLDALRYPASHLIAEPTADHMGFTQIPVERLSLASRWGLLFVGKNQDWVPGVRMLRVSHPDAALDWMLRKMHRPDWVGPSSQAPKGIVVEPGVHIGPDCEFGEGVVLESGVRLGARVSLGAGTRVRANAVLADDTWVGSSCDIGAGACLGNPGFGLIRYPKKNRSVQRAHVGRVVLGSEVRIGALVTVDRGVFEDTTIGSQSAIDNLVQIAHNCELGAGSIICALCALAGSTTTGENVTLAGMVGTKGHLHIGEGAVVAAQSGVTKDIPPGSMVKGYPPRPMAEALEIQALTTRLPELYRRLKDLEAMISRNS